MCGRFPYWIEKRVEPPGTHSSEPDRLTMVESHATFIGIFRRLEALASGQRLSSVRFKLMKLK